MGDKVKIIAGLAIFLILATFPIWYTLGAGEGTSVEVELPQGTGPCVEANMATRHMDVLDHWRNQVVRKGKKMYVSSSSGEEFMMSLTETCMDCHTSRESFCQRCHDYANVQPTCWDCHLESKGN